MAPAGSCSPHPVFKQLLHGIPDDDDDGEQQHKKVYLVWQLGTRSQTSESGGREEVGFPFPEEQQQEELEQLFSHSIPNTHPPADDEDDDYMSEKEVVQCMHADPSLNPSL